MNFAQLERRTQPRTQAYVPITLRLAHSDHDTPAHLLDLSCGGAALLATVENAPLLGEYLHLKFETPTNDGASEALPREELGLVVNLRKPERGITRIGVRFIHTLDSANDLPAPRDLLSDQRHSSIRSHGAKSDRWTHLTPEGNSKASRRDLAGASN